MFEIGKTAYVGTMLVKVIGVERHIPTDGTLCPLPFSVVGEPGNVVAYMLESKHGILRLPPDRVSRVMAMPCVVRRLAS